MISAEEARWIVRYLEPEMVVRRAWRAATETTNASVGLSMETGELATLRWRPDELPDVDGVIVLAWCSSSCRVEMEGRAAAYSEVPPSAEVVEEAAVRTARHAVSWDAVEQQPRSRFPELVEGERCT